MEKGNYGYIESDGNELAYVTVGNAPRDLLQVPTTFGSFDIWLDEPAASRLFEPITAFARLIAFDPRGVGASARSAEPAPLEEQMADVEAVLDAAGSTRTALLASGDGTGMAVMFAATYPTRVSHLIICHGQARTTRAEGYEWAMSAEERQSRLIEPLFANWGNGDLLVHMYLPILAAEDPGAARLGGRYMRQTGPPSEARPHYELSSRIDVREILSEVQAPTLIVDRPEATTFDSRHSEYLAEHIPGARLARLPGGDVVPAGDGAQALVEEIELFMAGEHARPNPSRALATVAFTDIVGSTERAAALGDTAWRKLLDRHDRLTRDLVAEHGGRPVKSTGDGFLATFDGPARAVRCTSQLAERVRDLGIDLRAGVHTGEIELLADDVAGIAVHIGARIAALAGAGEVLASSTVRDLAVGSGIEFTDHGRHKLKGVPEDWQLYRAGKPSA